MFSLIIYCLKWNLTNYSRSIYEPASRTSGEDLIFNPSMNILKGTFEKSYQICFHSSSIGFIIANSCSQGNFCSLMTMNIYYIGIKKSFGFYFVDALVYL